jgi:hypothetical protein
VIWKNAAFLNLVRFFLKLLLGREGGSGNFED